jgi:hypothetical protein
VTKRQLTKLAELLERVRRATKARGKKSELARWLGTEPQRVNDWLSGANAPGGEVTLLLLEWVTAEESIQNKSPGRALTRPEPKTPKGSNDEEVPKSEPAKGWPNALKKAIRRKG